MRYARVCLRLVVWAALSVLVVDCKTTPDAVTPKYDLTDLTGTYVAFFDRTQDLATDARVAAFKADVGARLPGFYDAARIPGMTPERYDAYQLVANNTFGINFRYGTDNTNGDFGDVRSVRDWPAGVRPGASQASRSLALKRNIRTLGTASPA